MHRAAEQRGTRKDVGAKGGRSAARDIGCCPGGGLEDVDDDDARWRGQGAAGHAHAR